MAPEHSDKTIRIPSRRPGRARRMALLAALAVTALTAVAVLASPRPRPLEVTARLTSASHSSAVEPAPEVTLLETIGTRGAKAGTYLDVTVALYSRHPDGTDADPVRDDNGPVTAHARVRAEDTPTEVPVTMDASTMAGR